jgi:hypothetical protein
MINTLLTDIIGNKTQAYEIRRKEEIYFVHGLNSVSSEMLVA